MHSNQEAQRENEKRKADHVAAMEKARKERYDAFVANLTGEASKYEKLIASRGFTHWPERNKDEIGFNYKHEDLKLGLWVVEVPCGSNQPMLCARMWDLAGVSEKGEFPETYCVTLLMRFDPETLGQFLNCNLMFVDAMMQLRFTEHESDFADDTE
jgi:hypothetical protein